MRYYASLGVEFRVCAIALQDFGYIADDLPDFVTVVPSGITELAHWQLQGYALIQPQVLTKKQRNEDIR
jgi:intracellular sulfur oxidation DsrE/DsrF family protein